MVWAGGREVLLSAGVYSLYAAGFRVECLEEVEMKRMAVFRAFWGFIAFLPFCWFWGVDNFTYFSFVGTVYFVPVHWIFDKVMKDGK